MKSFIIPCFLTLTIAPSFANGVEYWQAKPAAGQRRIDACVREASSIDAAVKNYQAKDATCRLETASDYMAVGYVITCHKSASLFAFRHERDCQMFKAGAAVGQPLDPVKLAPPGTKNPDLWVVMIEGCLSSGINPAVQEAGHVHQVVGYCECMADGTREFKNDADIVKDKNRKSFFSTLKRCSKDNLGMEMPDAEANAMLDEMANQIKAAGGAFRK